MQINSSQCIDGEGNFAILCFGINGAHCCKFNADGKLVYKSEDFNYIVSTDGNYILIIDADKMVKIVDINKNETIEIAPFTGGPGELATYKCEMYKNKDNPDLIEIFWFIDSESADYDKNLSGTQNVRYYFNTKTHEVTKKLGMGG